MSLPVDGEQVLDAADDGSGVDVDAELLAELAVERRVAGLAGGMPPFTRPPVS